MADLQICDDCRLGIGFGDAALCPKCSLPVAPTKRCGSCADRRYRFAETRALGPYDGTTRDIVRRLKHAHQESLCRLVGELLVRRIQDVPFSEPIDFIIPTPMHWLRRLTRGANNPEIISETIRKELRIPLLNDLVYFRRSTRKQGTLLPRERMRNMRDAFGISSAYDVRGTSILVIDDVMTTGATCNAIARELLRAGAKRVSIAVVARADR